MSPALSLGPAGSCDSQSVFSGSIVSKIVDGKRVLYLYYTSISALPIHWSKPYIKGCETQSLAWSADLGLSWNKNAANPILSKPRHEDGTTGWRDPFVSIWPSLSALRRSTWDTNYMLISSGRRNTGPELVLYQSSDLVDWSPCSVLFKAKADSSISPSSPFHHGRNFECASFFTLGGKDFILCGVETAPGATRHSSSNHADRYTLWMSGRLRLDANSKPIFVPESHGTLDHGMFYAPHVFRGAKNELLLSGWADEDLPFNSEYDLNKSEGILEQQGWAGCLALPRELYIQAQPIVETEFGMSDRHSWVRDEPSGMMTTLGVRPACHLRGLRSGSMMYPLAALASLCSANYEIGVGLPVSSTAEAARLIFNVRSSPDGRENTAIVIDLAANAVSIVRSRSSLKHGSLADERGTFSVLPGEGLQVRIFLDASMLEININDRFCMTSRIYPSLPESLGASCEFIGRNGRALDTENVWFQCWEGLLDAWPDRRRDEEGVADTFGDMETEDGDEVICEEDEEDFRYVDDAEGGDDTLSDMVRSTDFGMVPVEA